jgi:hypothetical protein
MFVGKLESFFANKKLEQNLIYLLYSIFIFYYLIKNIFIDISPISHDEVVNITTYLYKETLFLKNYPNNHVLTSIIGFFLSKIFGIQIIYFRLISFLSFSIIFFLFIKKFNNFFFLFTFLLLFIFSDNLYLYSFLFRGYYLSSLIFVGIFLLLCSNIKNKDRIIYAASVILIIHNVSTLFLIIPIIIFVFLEKVSNFKFYNFKSVILYFFLPFLISHIFLGLLNSVYISNFYLVFSDNNLTIVQKTKEFILVVFPNFTSGIKIIFFNQFTNVTLFGNLNNFYNFLFEDIVIFLILIFSLLISIYNIFFIKKISLLDKIIIVFFIIFIFLNKLPPIRVFVGFIYFFIFYIFFNLEKNIIDFFSSKKKYCFILFVILLFFSYAKKITYIKQNGNLDFWHLNLESKLNSKELKCNLSKEPLSEFDKHYSYYLYLRNCSLLPNLNEFRNFYKSNRLDS